MYDARYQFLLDQAKVRMLQDTLDARRARIALRQHKRARKLAAKKAKNSTGADGITVQINNITPKHVALAVARDLANRDRDLMRRLS